MKLLRRNMKGRAPTKVEKEWMNAICEDIGCIVSYNLGYPNTPASPHHTDGRTKPGCHFKTIPLSAQFHQTGGEGIAFHATGRKTWEAKYGTEAELLKQCKEILGG